MDWKADYLSKNTERSRDNCVCGDGFFSKYVNYLAKDTEEESVWLLQVLLDSKESQEFAYSQAHEEPGRRIRDHTWGPGIQWLVVMCPFSFIIGINMTNATSQNILRE